MGNYSLYGESMRIVNYCLNVLSAGVSRLLVRSKVLPEKPTEQYELNSKNPTFILCA